MKKLILKVFAVAALAGSAVSCGSEFLDTDYYSGVDVDSGLTNVTNIGYALNGTYYQLFRYYFAGNYATNIGDVASDISYWNTEKGHFNGIYQFTYQDTDNYLFYIWDYGYKVADNAARIIKAGEELEDLTPTDQLYLDVYLAEAYALRAYATFVMTNVYGHQIKVNGQDFSSQPGVVVIDEPVQVFTEVERSTVGECYAAIQSDLNNSIAHFQAAGTDQGELTYFNLAAVYGLQARVNLYMENWSAAATAAQKALNEAGIDELAYGNDYAALYGSGYYNWESFFALGIDGLNNWSANSSGTLWSTYGYSPSPKLKAMFGPNDVRTSIWDEGDGSTEMVPYFNSGKFVYGGGNSAYATHYLINAPEMFLIIAEANAKQGNVDAAKAALMVVAQRNPDITAADLGSTADEVMAFLKDERARELFQEGHRLYDLRRWDEMADVYAYGAPAIQYTYTNYKISDLVFPIPVDEINAGFGVKQTEGWASTKPR